ncbi:MAG: FAD:protein FMN transferase, partial [Flavobacteriales bacterium]|nr:FAD:protein FMN transferase [Flavobacteriales bacterium]
VVDSIMQSVGMEHIIYVDDSYSKSNSSVQLDVNAIAQGYSVDVLAKFLEAKGIKNYLVEIGGEVRAKGIKPKRQPWKVGIDRPLEEDAERELALSLELRDKAMATSGNYRKFVEVNGQKFGHTLNPQTGYPATTDVLSATVIAHDCMTADAMATAFMVMGYSKAKLLIEENAELEAVLIYSNSSGIQTWNSTGLNDLIP